MSKSVRLALGLAVAAAMMAGFATNSSARNLSLSRGFFRATWNPITFTEPFGNTVNCPLTLEGSFAGRTIAKVSYTLLGRIIRAIPGTRAQCTGGEVTILAESLPWHRRYQGFEGTLPDITRFVTLSSRMSLRIFSAATGVTCLFTAQETTREHVRTTINREAGGELTSVELSGEITSTEACAFGMRVVGRLSGTSRTLTSEEAAVRIRITLI
jgi:hypothetical protein